MSPRADLVTEPDTEPDTDTEPSTGAGARAGWVVRSVRPHVWRISAIVALLLVNVIKDPSYLSIRYSDNTGAFVGNLLDIARAAAPVLLLAIGMCLVIATGGIDLSVGSMMAVSGAVCMEYLNGAGAPESVGAAATAILLMLAVCAGLGAVSGTLVSTIGLQPFIATLVMMLAGRGLAKVITSGQNTTATNDPYRWIANGYVLGVPVVVAIGLAIAIVVGLVVRRSALGMMIEAIGINPTASRLAGINRRALLLAVYTASAVLAGVAGVFSTGSVMTVDVSQTGYQLELDAILAVVIGGTSLAGGTFSLGGAAIGAVLIATLDKTVVFLGVPSSATPAFKAVVIVTLYLAQSDRFGGFIGRRRRPAAPRTAEVGA